MAHRHKKRCSVSLIIREMQIETITRYHLTSVRMAITNKSTNNKCWWGCGERGALLNCWWECGLVQPLWKAVWRYLKTLKMDLPFDLVMPLLGIYLKEPKTNSKEHKHSIFLAALLTIAKKRKQPKCPSVDEWTKQRRDIYAMEYYSAVKKEGKFALCNSMDGPGEHYAKHNKPV